MNGELAQVIFLATHGTDWLSDAAQPVSLIEPYVRSLVFRMEGRRGVFRRPRPMPDVAAWLDHLRQQGMERLWLVVPESSKANDGEGLDPHIAVAFAGGSQWEMLATGDKGSERWAPVWELGDDRAGDGRIWDITYWGIPQSNEPPIARPSVAAASAGLEAALSDARAFAVEQDASPWPDVFQRALGALSPGAEEPFTMSDLLPAAYPAEARRLLSAAARAWVFGGMGSWNDLGFEPAEAQTTYQELSRTLYAAVLTACVAAVNVDLS